MFSFLDLSVEVSDNCGGKHDGGVGGELHRNTKLPENKVSPLGWIIRSQAGNGAPTSAQVLGVLVGVSTDLAAQVEGHR